MKFSVSKDSLYDAITIVSKGITTHTTRPILSGILLNAQDGTLSLQTTNLDTSIHHKISAIVDTPGMVVVPGKIFMDIIKKLPDAAVSFELTDQTLKVSCERSVFQIHTLMADDFPDFPQYELNQTVELPTQTLLSMVNKTKKAVSRDKNRAILNGILTTVENNRIRLVATDSYRLAVADTTSETSSINEKFELIVPGEVFSDALSAAKGEDSILLGSTNNQVVFMFGNTIYISRKIEGNFPNYKQLLPDECETKVKLKSKDLHDALDRVSVIAQATTPVKFGIDVDGGLLTLTTKMPDEGSSKENLEIEVEGNSLDIAFNYRYVLDGLVNETDEDEVIIELQSSLKPGIFKHFGTIDFLYLVMPVRMN